MASYLGSPIAALNAKTSTRENEDTDTNQQKSDFFGCVGDSVGAQIISNENVLMRAKSLCSPRDYSGDQAKQDISLRNTNIVNRKEEKLQVETNAPNGHGGVLSFDNYIGSPIVKLMKILNSEGPKVNKSNGGTNKKYGPTLECNDFSRNKNNETYRRNLGYTEPQNDFNPGDNRRDTSTLREYPIEKQSSYNSSSQSNGSNDSKGSSLKSEAFKRKKNSFRHKKKEKLSPLITKFSDTSITIEVPNRWRSVQQHETRKDIPIFDMVSPLNGEFITSTTDELGSSEPKAFFSEREPSVSPKAIISDPRSSSFSSDADIVKPMKNDKGKASYSKELTGSFSKNSLENGSCAETNNNMVENCSTTKRSIECEVNALTRNTEFGYPCLEKKNLGAETLVEVNNSLGSVPSLTDVLSRVSHYTDKENIVSVSEDVILSESTESTMCHEFKSKKNMVASDESIRTTDMLGHVLDKLESEVRPVRENRRIPPKNDKRLRARRRHDVRPPKVQEKNLELETISLNPHERTRSARKPSDLKPTSAQRRTRSGAEVVRPKIVQTRTRSATQYQSSPSPISLRNGRATPESIAGSRGSHTMGSRSRSCGPRSTSNEFRHSRSYDPRKVVLRQRYSQADNKNPLFDYEEDSLEDMNNYGAKNLPTKLSKQQSVLDKALDKYLDFVEDVFGV
uniref:Uncharacterized protein n=1 Tax=Corethron hystrix TaxID=216773 RepID=A0A7S1FKW8_9STRA